MVWAGCKVRLVLKATRVILDHKDLKAFLVSVAHKGLKVILAILDRRATKERRVILDRRASVAPKAHRVSKVLPAHKGLKVILAMLVHKDRKVTKALREILVTKAILDRKANLARTAQAPQSLAQRQV